MANGSVHLTPTVVKTNHLTMSQNKISESDAIR
jgi:hypothetical protein